MNGFKEVVNTIRKRTAAHHKKVMDFYERSTENNIEAMTKAKEHMEHSLIRLTQRLFETFPKLKRYIKVDRHGYAKIYHIEWRNIPFEMEKAIQIAREK